MLRILTYLIALSILLILWSCKQTDHNGSVSSVEAERVISLSGFLTELLFDMGLGDNIVACDVTSSYPSEIKDIPNLGHISQLNVEAILQMQPDIILLEESQVQQAQALKQLENANIKIVPVPTSLHLDNSLKAAKALQEHLTIDETNIEELASNIEADSIKLEKILAQFTNAPKVLFIYARGAGRLMVGGKNTSASVVIEKAGGKNAIQSFENFQALTPEALIEASPDVILMFTTGLASLDGKDGLSQISGVAQTPAFKNDRIIAMDGHYLTAFGPRIGKAAIELAEKIHKE